jgi:hypothetical protein
MRKSSARHYREQAATMRMFAQSAPDDAMRQKFLDLAADYDKLVQSAEDVLKSQ